MDEYLVFVDPPAASPSRPYTLHSAVPAAGVFNLVFFVIVWVDPSAQPVRKKCWRMVDEPREQEDGYLPTEIGTPVA